MIAGAACVAVFVVLAVVLPRYAWYPDNGEAPVEHVIEEWSPPMQSGTAFPTAPADATIDQQAKGSRNR